MFSLHGFYPMLQDPWWFHLVPAAQLLTFARIGVSGHDASKGVEADQPLRGVKICKFWELKGCDGCAVLNGQLGGTTVAPHQIYLVIGNVTIAVHGTIFVELEQFWYFEIATKPGGSFRTSGLRFHIPMWWHSFACSRGRKWIGCGFIYSTKMKMCV